MEYADGEKFIGVYDEDYKKKGEYIYANGNKFIGEWNENEYRSGKGEMIWHDGDVYIGEYKDGYRTGKGELNFADGSRYVGEFFESMLSGYGVMTWDDGSIYKGWWKNGNYHGKGTIEYENGNKYVGFFIDGLEDGYGVYEWPDGEKYEGEWKKGLKEGKGKYTYESGTIYEGDFLNNYAQGKGKFIYSDGAKYEGEVKEGNENGQGEMLYPNGDIYVGQWKNGYPHGQGKIVYANGNIYEGLFEDGKEAEGKTTLAKFTTNEKYYALIIGNNDYDELVKLDNAVNDAIDLDKVLKKKYGFETILMLDKKADEIEKAIIEFTDNRKRNDNILIYYAGHGKLIKKQKLERGYWLPVDAGPKRDPNWISNNDIKDSIASSNAKHILLIVDSCFSGSLMRGSGENKSVEKLTSKNLDRLKSKTTRLVITSGGNEDVADGIGEAKNSVFAEPLINVLKNNTDVIRSYELFNEVRTFVINNADQTPNHSLIHGTGHDGGEFLFFPKS